MPKHASETRKPRTDRSLETLVNPRLAELVDKMDCNGKGCLHEQVIDGIERPLIRLVLERTGGNQLRAADMLGINRNTLRKKIEHLGIDVKKTKRGNGA
jgi:two-component system, NtrC family, nitrogen regulation response regulator GlnG